MQFKDYIRIKDLIRLRLAGLHEYLQIIQIEQNEGLAQGEPPLFDMVEHGKVLDGFVNDLIDIDNMLDDYEDSSYKPNYIQLLVTRENNRRHMEGEE